MLLPLPSERAFLPSPDPPTTRHLSSASETSRPTTSDGQSESGASQSVTSQSVTSQCCEIMGGSSCRPCRKMESRLLNREKAIQECPRFSSTHSNIAVTQIVKRLFPYLNDEEVQDKIARGEINRNSFQQRNSLPSASIE